MDLSELFFANVPFMWNLIQRERERDRRTDRISKWAFGMSHFKTFPWLDYANLFELTGKIDQLDNETDANPYWLKAVSPSVHLHKTVFMHGARTDSKIGAQLVETL